MTTQFRLWLSESEDSYRNLDYAAWTVLFALPEVMLIHTGQKIINEANLFSEKIFSYVQQEENEFLLEKPIVLLHVAGNKRLALTACHFAIIDHKLGLTLCTACLTYFIVLAQYGRSGF
ncbi:Hypothetical protein NTJ_02122 [Nesidiocoris tenuis]|uniref:Uncharacterized protein n=1 Tax=Nesidiocoris tenuis TaxID=355587 RepID=A0ABN7AAM8_9HEMI|nr:Hypothetical protein NTJ_02122 [Nesidiocoris tenuis]